MIAALIELYEKEIELIEKEQELSAREEANDAPITADTSFERTMIKSNLREMIIRAKHRIRRNEIKIEFTKDDEVKNFLKDQNERERQIIEGLEKREAFY